MSKTKKEVEQELERAIILAGHYHDQAIYWETKAEKILEELKEHNYEQAENS